MEAPAKPFWIPCPGHPGMTTEFSSNAASCPLCEHQRQCDDLRCWCAGMMEKVEALRLTHDQEPS